MGGELYVLTGETAVGKTELSLRWAEDSGAEIVSCDSLLFYRGMDIGTAKPAAEERRRVPHHLIDVRDVAEAMNVVDYVALARRAAAEIASRHRKVLVVGGSGFYLRGFFGPVGDDVAVPAETRQAVAAKLAAEGPPALVEELRGRNAGELGELDVANPRRVVRALERCRTSGRTLADLAAEFARKPGAFADWTVHVTRLEREPRDLERRIGLRVEAMLRAGLVDEVRRLRAAGLERNPSAAGAIGYRETLDHLRGELRESDLGPAIARNTRALVKKQRTWFRTQLPAHRVVAAEEVDAGTLF